MSNTARMSLETHTTELSCDRMAGDTLGIEKLRISASAGVPNQAIGKPVTVDAATGEVIVKKFTGKERVRKGQTQEQYEEQLGQFCSVEGGPANTPVGWMDKDGAFAAAVAEQDLEVKHSRLVLMGFVHKAYYEKQYAKCLELCETVNKSYALLECGQKRMKREYDELAYIAQKCELYIRRGDV